MGSGRSTDVVRWMMDRWKEGDGKQIQLDGQIKGEGQIDKEEAVIDRWANRGRWTDGQKQEDRLQKSEIEVYHIRLLATIHP